jgi:hypothetical protein
MAAIPGPLVSGTTLSYYEDETKQKYYDYFGIGEYNKETSTPEGKLHRSISAHEIILYIIGPKNRDYPIGRAQRLSARRDFGTEPVFEIGSMKPQEFVPLRYEGTVDLERYLVRLDDLKGIMDRVGIKFSLSNEGKILAHSTLGFNIRVQDKYDNRIIREYKNCVVRSCDEEIRAGAIVGETMSLYYSECSDQDDRKTK